MTSEVLDITALSPYTLSRPTRENDDGTNSIHSLSSRKSIGEEARSATWRTEEATLSRGTGPAHLPKEKDEDSDSVVPRDSTTTAGEEEKDWHPLQEAGNLEQDTTVVVDLGDSIVDSSGRLLFPDSNAKTSPSPSRRASGIKEGTSPPPWEVIQPPSNNGHREYGGGAKVLRPS